MQEEKEILERHIKSKGLKNTPQRYKVLEVFLNNEEHFSVDELYDKVNKKHPEIGHSTVFRTMKLVQQSGLAIQIRDEKGLIKFEHAYKHKHHDHMICTNCGRIIEFENKEIEKLQDKVAKNYGFKTIDHSLKLTGLCKNCQ